MLELIVYVVLFIALSGLMAAIEAAILTVSKAEVKELQMHKAWGAEALHAITERITRPVVVMVIITNTINVLGPILAGRKAIQLYGDVALGAITTTLTLGTIVFSEIIPKSLGSHYAPLISRMTAPAIRVLIVALFPLVVILEWLTSLMKSGQRRIGTEAQIRSLAKMGRRAGFIESHEGRMIIRAFILNDRTAADIMTPLDRVVALSATDTVQEAAERLRQSEFTRYPVFGETPNDVQGLVIIRDLLEALADGRGDEPVASIARTCLTVDDDRRSDELLMYFRYQHSHLAIVARAGETLGVVSLEDVLEELVGEINDEKDIEAVASRTDA